MDFFEVIQNRYSCRKFSDKAVEREKVVKCIDAARKSPSAVNSQPWKFVLVDNAEILPKIKENLSFNKFAAKAPALIVIIKEKGNLPSKVGDIIKGNDFSSIDIGIATQSLCLALAAEGINSCILGMFKDKPIRQLLNIPKSRKIALVLAIGYEEAPPKKRTPRKNLDEILSYNKY